MNGRLATARAAATGAVVADHLRVADGHWGRLRGLLGTRALAPGAGLWLKPSRQVHMLGMRYAVDLAFLDDERRVVRTVEGLQPWRVSPHVEEASSVIELPAGTLARTGLHPGERLAIEGGEAAPRSGIATLLCNLLVAAYYLRFAWSHVSLLSSSGSWALPPLVLQEALLVVFFLTRRRSLATTERPGDWAVGIAGMLLPLLMRPIDPAGPLAVIGVPLQVIGLSLAVLGAASIGRSIGIVAADRGVRTFGLYRFVRHPMYAAYIISYLGYAAEYPRPENFLIVAATIVALHLRAVAEERFLARDAGYRGYLARVRWRFLPAVY
jgi:protein-S-isoprenylcysteine O-methyltransferase Ste14/uncharacterized membrane protein (UPF0127 family)